MTVICGSLGAGKTTLVNHLLAGEPRGSVLVIENELASDPVDGDLVAAPRRDVVALPGGCICCGLLDELVPILVETVRDHALRRAFSGGPPLRRVLVETTGVADPMPILHSLYAAAEAIAPLALDSAVCLVDGRSGGAALDEDPVASAQVAAADVVIVNKTDLLEASALVVLLGRIEAVNPTARLIATRDAIVDPDAVLDLGGIDVERIERLPSGQGGAGETGPATAHGLVACSLRVAGALDLLALQRWLEGLLTVLGPDLRRVKGVLAIGDRDRRLLLHGVHDQFDCRYGEPWGAAPAVSRLVLIGRDLPHQRLQDGLASCLAPVPSKRKVIHDR